MRNSIVFLGVVIIIGLLLFVLTGCGDDNASAKGGNNATGGSDMNSIAANATVAATNTTNEATSSVSNIVTKEEDPFSVYEVPGKLGLVPSEYVNFYVKKGEKRYLVTAFSKYTKDSVSLGFGMRETKFHEISFYGTFKWKGENMIMSYGDVPILTLDLKAGDSLIEVSSRDMYDVVLRQVSFYGNGLMRKFDGGDIISYRYGGSYVTSNCKDIKIRDSNENVVDNPYRLNKDEKYTVTYYVGTKYIESYPQFPEANIYTYQDDGSKFSPKLTQNGYAEFDLSELTPGYYAVIFGTKGIYSLEGILEIK